MLGFVRDLGVDLGTVNTVVYVEGRGIVLNEPSVVAVDRETGHVLAVGSEAHRMLGRTPGNIVAARPLRGGVIADFTATATLLKMLLKRAVPQRLGLRPRMVVCVPSGVTTVERRAVIEAGYEAGARKVYLLEEPVAAALGAGLAIHEPGGHMVVDVGGGTTDIAVLSLGGVVVATSTRTGGDTFDEAIVRYVKRQYNVLIGERTAEQAKIAIGTAVPPEGDGERFEVRGRDLVTGLPRTLHLSAAEVQQALEEPLAALLAALRGALERVPPELAADILHRGLVLTGGGSLLRGLDRRIADATGLPVVRPEQPLLTVALGTGVALSRLDRLDGVLIAG
ncbi:rod shape-determining protein MreB [Thermaerobacter marianensis DSM 12885]|uniref:Cell shape-determining protein MreB n=1 Tax=Thermaerobacter marianensis (strain ATCC 700841 / DSM 12885 / JCM 10246 / 7p75a) TaxID=644966 RepID=E6SLN3_THEM7|nr:rod shape-determining protein [Thermaerobacter marianensis]ADU50300.1 rod shape-determining protein MreB [Thermaerobacter marianensis DSM 12885]